METVRRANFRLRQLRRTSSRRMRAQAAIGGDPSVNHTGCGHARARGAGRFQRALTPTDRHRPAGRRCGCWPTSTVRFSGICCSQIWRRTLALGIGADADVGFAWSGRRWCRRTIERSELPGHRQQIGKSAALSADITRVHHFSHPLALMMAGAGGAMRATGWRATAIRFQQLR